MVIVAQLVRASLCGGEGCGFESRRSPRPINVLLKTKEREMHVRDIERSLNALDCIESSMMGNLRLADPIDLIFWMCPKRQTGYLVNDAMTGLTTTFTNHQLSDATTRQIESLVVILGEIRTKLVVRSITAIFASADALIIPAIPLREPIAPEVHNLLPREVRIQSNYDSVLLNLMDWATFYRVRPWERYVSPSILSRQRQHHEKLLGDDIVTSLGYLVSDFVRRCFAGYALDGALIRKGEFGRLENPVILGIESSGLANLQNAGLSPEDQIPLINISRKYRGVRSR